MRRWKLGRWFVAAELVACAVVGLLLVARDWNEGPACAPSSIDARSRRAAPDVPVVGRVPRAMRHPSQPAEVGLGGKGGFVVVRVTSSEDGTPLQGAAVGVPEMDAGDERVWRIAGPDGVARLGPLAAYEWPLVASAKGRLARSVQLVVPEADEIQIEVALDSAATVAVHVEDGAGEAIVGAAVKAEPLGGGDRADGTTDRHGRALLGLAHDAVVRVTAKADGFDESQTVVRTGPAGAEATPVTIRLGPPGRLVGVVRYADGSPVAHAVVIVRPVHDPIDPPNDSLEGRGYFGRGLTLRGESDALGRYSVNGLASGRRHHAFAALGGGQRLSSAAVEDLVPLTGTDLSCDFTVAPVPTHEPGELVVHVTNADGSVETNANVCADGMRGCTDPLLKSGSARAAFLVRTAAEITVVAVAPGRSAHRRVTVPPGETLEVTLQLGPAPQVSGVLVDDLGHQVANARVCIRMESVLDEFRTTSDDDGAWRIQAPLAGAFTLGARAQGHLDVRELPVSAPSDGVRIVLVRTASVKFRLVSPSGVFAEPTVRIGSRMGSCQSGEEPHSYWLDYGPGDGDRIEILFGPKSFGQLPSKPTAADLETVHAEFAPIVRTLRPPMPGEVQDLGDLPLERPSMQTVRVVDVDGRPVANAEVRLDVNSNQWTVHINGRAGPPTTNASGAVSFRCAPAAGLVPLVVTATGFLTRRVQVSAGGSETPAITLLRGGLVWGEVVDAAGAPVGDAVVEIADEPRPRIARTDARGVFGVRIDAGRWLLTANGGTAESAQATEGGDTHVRLVAGGR